MSLPRGPSSQALRALAAAPVVMIAIGVATSAAVACLPDLDPIPELVLATTPVQPCGDGVVASSPDGGGESCDPGDASVPGCLDCKVTCSEGQIDESTGHCYFLSPVRASRQADALAACQQAGAHLVTIASQAEADRASAIASGGAYWVGLAYQSNQAAYVITDDQAGLAFGLETGWPGLPGGVVGPCPGCFGFGLDGGGLAGENDGGDGCVASLGPSDASVWQDVPCIGASATGGAGFATICEREPAGHRFQSCGGGFCFDLAPTLGKKSYVLVPSADSSDNAVNACAALGGRLVEMDSAEERVAMVRVVADIFSDAIDHRLWIGVAPDGQGGWMWDDKNGARPIPWGDRQPLDDGAGRGYLRVGQHYDSGLVYVDPVPDPATPDASTSIYPFLCELPVTP